MKDELMLLKTMLKEKKISQDDYQLIDEALNKKSFCSEIESSVFLNPFQKIAGLKALIIGLVIMIAMSLIGAYAKVYFDGALSASTAFDIKSNYPPSFYLLMYQNIINVAILSIFFLILAKIFGKQKIRIIDFFGTVALSRYPYLVLTVVLWLFLLLDPALFTQQREFPIVLHFKIASALLQLSWTVCYWWQLLTYFFALRVSSGLDGKPLWISFIIAITLGDFVAMHLGRIFLYM